MSYNLDTINQPLISVIVPTYNCADFLPTTIRSVLAQTHQNWELLILDDGSTDSTEAVVAPFLTDSRIQYTRLPKQDSCGAKVRNIGYRQSKGRYVCFLDSDDLLYPTSLDMLLTPLLADSTKQFSKAFFTCIDEHERLIRNRGIQLVPVANNAYKMPNGFVHDLKTMMDVRFSCQLATVLFRREVLEQLGPFREDLSHSDDFEFFIRMMVNVPGGMVTIPDYTLQYRIRSNALTYDVSKLDALIGCHIQVLTDIYQWPNLPQECQFYKQKVMVNAYRRAARNQLNLSRPGMVWYLAKQAWKNPIIDKIELLKQFSSILLQASLPMFIYFFLVNCKYQLRSLVYQGNLMRCKT